MKIQQLNFLLTITAFVFMLVSGCSESKSPVSPELTVTNNEGSGSLTLAKVPAELQQIVTYMQQNNMERATFFFDVSNLGTALGIVDWTTGQFAFFSGNYGPGDFLRMNPDGTYSLKLVTNKADAFTIDPVTGGVYTCTGTAHMNYKWNGTGYDIIPGLGIIMFPDASLNAAVIKGHATVYDPSGVDPNPHTVHMQYVTNPGGGGHLRITFN